MTHKDQLADTIPEMPSITDSIIEAIEIAEHQTGLNVTAEIPALTMEELIEESRDASVTR